MRPCESRGYGRPWSSEWKMRTLLYGALRPMRKARSGRQGSPHLGQATGGPRVSVFVTHISFRLTNLHSGCRQVVNSARCS
eukprot:692549-Alexandrium_andersonii.AAC.1